MAYTYTDDLQYDIMSYCLKSRGKWWANHFFRNKEVNLLYNYLVKQELDTIWDVVYWNNILLKEV